ncbi:MAG: hypothetical protein IH809_05690, partial [Proteobacteria bacterium]|nr:hypothetical protein [Pseudomonadota bacterium]
RPVILIIDDAGLLQNAGQIGKGAMNIGKHNDAGYTGIPCLQPGIGKYDEAGYVGISRFCIICGYCLANGQRQDGKMQE